MTLNKIKSKKRKRYSKKRKRYSNKRKRYSNKRKRYSNKRKKNNYIGGGLKDDNPTGDHTIHLSNNVDKDEFMKLMGDSNIPSSSDNNPDHTEKHDSKLVHREFGSKYYFKLIYHRIKEIMKENLDFPNQERSDVYKHLALICAEFYKLRKSQLDKYGSFRFSWEKGIGSNEKEQVKQFKSKIVEISKHFTMMLDEINLLRNHTAKVLHVIDDVKKTTEYSTLPLLSVLYIPTGPLLFTELALDALQSTVEKFGIEGDSSSKILISRNKLPSSYVYHLFNLIIEYNSSLFDDIICYYFANENKILSFKDSKFKDTSSMDGLYHIFSQKFSPPLTEWKEFLLYGEPHFGKNKNYQWKCAKNINN
jgi:hypothetical protein